MQVATARLTFGWTSPKVLITTLRWAIFRSYRDRQGVLEPEYSWLLHYTTAHHYACELESGSLGVQIQDMSLTGTVYSFQLVEDGVRSCVLVAVNFS